VGPERISLTFAAHAKRLQSEGWAGHAPDVATRRAFAFGYSPWRFAGRVSWVTRSSTWRADAAEDAAVSLEQVEVVGIHDYGLAVIVAVLADGDGLARFRLGIRLSLGVRWRVRIEGELSIMGQNTYETGASLM